MCWYLIYFEIQITLSEEAAFLCLLKESMDLFIYLY